MLYISLSFQSVIGSQAQKTQTQLVMPSVFNKI